MTGRERRLAMRLSAEGFIMLIVLILLFLATLVLFQDGSFAWFSRNVKNNVGGMQVKVDSVVITVKYYKAVGDGNFVPLASPEDLFAGMMPGDSVKIRVDYESHAAEDTLLAVRLEPTEDGDSPLEIDGRYYYLATQLKIKEIDEFILTPPADRVSYDAPVHVPVTELGEVTVPAGSSASFIFTVTFVNYPDADQSAYQGTLGSYRTIVSEIAD